MVSSSVLTAVLIFPVPDADQLAEITGRKPADPISVRFTTRSQRAGFRGHASALLGASRRTAIPDPFEVIPPLLGMYRQLSVISGLPKSELKRLRETTAQRLIAMHGVLNRRESARKRNEDKSATSRVNERLLASGAAGSTPELTSLGATEAENAQALIALIENTVDPDSWQSRGGNGRAIYIGGRIKALVIRQTDEVHEQIGGTLGTLRRAQ